jgi:hypothetical protein
MIIFFSFETSDGNSNKLQWRRTLLHRILCSAFFSHKAAKFFSTQSTDETNLSAFTPLHLCVKPFVVQTKRIQ